MDVKPSRPVLVANQDRPRPDKARALEAVRTLIEWAGDDPDRAGLVDTPERVLKAYRDWFSGYGEDAAAELGRTFDELEAAGDFVMLREVEVESHCEHHLAPFLGRASVAYIPGEKVVGISKLARVVEIFSRRLQSQEALTRQIADVIEEVLKPQGVAVMIDARHQCMTTRGVHHRDVSTVTTRFTGAFQDDPSLQTRFLSLARQG
ncbi:GTP cyclohydrolase I FolE [Brevundimonas sp. 2R-24]|uniref:GTP cyclohydrolase 1 n=1 Tax=Peiella sedimenti TaxID=3061083 RepID=A0ABT8SM08_9CAUL|nr:GTP cyclohydrolase I FolE [Caulobacteraceae bacterium XZ-24]